MYIFEKKRKDDDNIYRHSLIIKMSGVISNAWLRVNP